MKKSILFLTIASLSTSVTAEEVSSIDKLKSFVGMETTQTQTADTTQAASKAVDAMPNASDLVSMLTNSLSVSSEQANGGMGAIFNYVKENVSVEQFKQLAQYIPGVEGLLKQVPDISELSSSEGLSGLLDSASQYNDSLKSVNEVKKQFEALGLKPEMISSFISQTQSYLDTEQGQKAKEIFSQGISNLMG